MIKNLKHDHPLSLLFVGNMHYLNYDIRHLLEFDLSCILNTKNIRKSFNSHTFILEPYDVYKIEKKVVSYDALYNWFVITKKDPHVLANEIQVHLLHSK